MITKVKLARERAFPGTIAVAGAAGRFGKLVVRRLHRTDEVISIDPRTFQERPADVEHYRTELRRRGCRDLFRAEEIRAVIHLAHHYAATRDREELFQAAVED